MIRYDHKSETFCAHPLQKHIQNTEQNTFGVLVVKLFTASIHRKRDEMHIMFVVNNFSPVAHTLTIRRPLELGKQNHQQSSHRHRKSSRLSNLLWRCHPGSRYRVNRGHPRENKPEHSTFLQIQGQQSIIFIRNSLSLEPSCVNL